MSLKESEIKAFGPPHDIMLKLSSAFEVPKCVGYDEVTRWILRLNRDLLRVDDECFKVRSLLRNQLLRLEKSKEENETSEVLYTDEEYELMRRETKQVVNEILVTLQDLDINKS